ncbi:MAG: ABC transporter substrate-binding protein [Chloroflexi bacterium]|nr:ABC transporter substrate-binding protein [Chloroflexota bacterium]
MGNRTQSASQSGGDASAGISGQETAALELTGTSRRRLLLACLSGVGVISLAACGASSAASPTSSSSSAASSVQSSSTATTQSSSASTTQTASSTATTSSAVASSATAPSGTKVSLRWVTNHSAPRVKLFDQLAQQFEQANPGIAVTVQNETSTQYDTTVISTWAASGSLPDVFYNRTFYTAFRAYQGWTVSLDSYIQRDKVSLSQYYPVEMQNCTWQSKIQSLPYDWSVFAIYYNKDMFKSAGVTPPPPDGNWTWNDLRSMAQHFTKTASGRQVQWGYNGQPNGWVSFGVLEANGGQILSADLKKCIIADQQNASTLQFFNDLVHKWHVSPGPGDISQAVQDPFASGLVAMEYQGSWAVLNTRSLIGSRFDWDVAPLPKGSTGKLPTTGAGGAWSIGVNSKQKDGAWNLVKFITSAKADSFLVSQQVGSVPGNIDASSAYLKAIAENPQPPKSASVFPKEAKEVFPVPNIPYYNQFITILGQKISAVYAGQPAMAMLQQLEQSVNAIIPQFHF